MAARQQHKTKNILITVGIFLLIVLAVGMFGILTHGFQTLPGKIVIETGEELIVRDKKSMKITPGTKFSVKTLGKEYGVSIQTKEAREDFTFTAGGKTYSWNEAIAGKDAGEAIEVIKEGNVFLLEFGTLPEIISGLIGEPVTMEEKDGEQDLFLMTVSSGKNEINIEFTALVPTEITLPDEIIF
jgi:hypothetical protein